jgi:hypothetical protein
MYEDMEHKSIGSGMLSIHNVCSYKHSLADHRPQNSADGTLILQLMFLKPILQLMHKEESSTYKVMEQESIGSGILYIHNVCSYKHSLADHRPQNSADSHQILQLMFLKPILQLMHKEESSMYEDMEHKSIRPGILYIHNVCSYKHSLADRRP